MSQLQVLLCFAFLFICGFVTASGMAMIPLRKLRLDLSIAQVAEAQLSSIVQYLDKQLAEREWVGLTDEEIHRAYNDVLSQPMREQDKTVVFNVCRAIEAKLKEKNNG